MEIIFFRGTNGDEQKSYFKSSKILLKKLLMDLEVEGIFGVELLREMRVYFSEVESKTSGYRVWVNG